MNDLPRSARLKGFCKETRRGISQLVSRVFVSRALVSRVVAWRFQRQPWKTGSLIVVVGIVTRLLALPWAETTNGDAITRGQWALQWATDPHWIRAGVWLPFSTYVTGLSLKVFPWPIWTPILLNIVLTSLAALCLWQFTLREFFGTGMNSDRAGSKLNRADFEGSDHQEFWREAESVSTFVAIAFLLTPLSFRTSLMALSEPLTILMLGLTLLCLSQARRPEGRLSQALLGGICLTLASAIRYEIWILIPFFVGVLWRKPRFLLVCGLAALAFPLVWMADSWAQYGEPLYPLTYQVLDTSQVLAINGGMTLTKRLVRLVFFPMTLVFGLTFGAFGLAGVGALRAIFRPSPTRIWLLPFGVLLALLSYKAVSGTLNMEERYSLNLAFLLLPFAAECFRLPRPQRGRSGLRLSGLRLFGLRLSGVKLQGMRLSGPRLRQLVLLSMFPLGYVLYLAQPVAPLLLKGIQRSPAQNIAPIPRLPPETRSLIAVVQRHRRLAPLPEPVVVWGFESNQVESLILFHNGVLFEQGHKEQGHKEQGHKFEVALTDRVAARLKAFGDRHPQGLLMIEDHPRVRALFPDYGEARAVLTIPGGIQWRLERLERGEGYGLYRYGRV